MNNFSLSVTVIDEAPNPLEILRALEGEARRMAHRLELFDLAANLTLRWHKRLRTTAGQASAHQSRIFLNPRLLNFPVELRRTFLHEMAHLVAYARYPHRRIASHGVEWKRACVDLGIPGEPRCHSLSLAPQRKRRRKYFYRCPHCTVKIARVVPLRHREACVACCRIHARGKYDSRFRFVPDTPWESEFILEA